MIRSLKIIALLMLVLCVVVAGLTYSWTFTPLGRLDYVPAIMAKMASWSDAPVELTPTARRAANARVLNMMGGEEADLQRIEDRTIEANGTEIPLRIYWPHSDRTLPFYLDIHGGGWWMGNDFSFHKQATRLAAAAEAIVVSVDYRLAPENPYPAALDDCMAVLKWIHENAKALGGDPARIAIGGGSAGGNLAAALTTRARDEGSY